MNGMEPFAGDFENYAYKILIKDPIKKDTIDALYNKITVLYGSEEKYVNQRIKEHVLFSEYDKLLSRYKNAQYLKTRVSKALCRIVLLKLFIHQWKKNFLHTYYSPDNGKGFLKGKKSWEESINQYSVKML